MANEILNQMIAQSLFKANPQLRGLDQFVQPMIDPAKSARWNADQQAAIEAASKSGIPSFQATPTDSPARLRLIDAITRTQSAGYKFPYFIGTPNEPTGDRGVTMDVENLVKALKEQEKSAIKSRDPANAIRIQLERAFWEKEAAQGMSAKEWKDQTGENDPVYPK